MKAKSIAAQLLESARVAARIEQGELKDGRITQYLSAARAEVVPPPVYNAGQIRETRDHMEFPQPVFAAALNVRSETVRAWEQGKRDPDGPTLRLLEVAEQHPDVFICRVHVREPATGRRVG